MLSLNPIPKLHFPVLSDMDNGYALMLNLAFLISDEMRRAMIKAGWDFSPYQGNTNWTLPIPATFVLDRGGRVKARLPGERPRYRRHMDAERYTRIPQVAGNGSGLFDMSAGAAQPVFDHSPVGRPAALLSECLQPSIAGGRQPQST